MTDDVLSDMFDPSSLHDDLASLYRLADELPAKYRMEAIKHLQGIAARVQELEQAIGDLNDAVHNERARVETLTQENERLREDMMRVGLLAVSDRQDGCINRTTALRIREIVYRACWPDDEELAS